MFSNRTEPRVSKANDGIKKAPEHMVAILKKYYVIFSYFCYPSSVFKLSLDFKFLVIIIGSIISPISKFNSTRNLHILDIDAIRHSMHYVDYYSDTEDI